MDDVITRALTKETGHAIQSMRRIHSGVSDAYAVTLDDGTPVFVKTAQSQPLGWASAEAESLRWLSDARALRVPAVIAVRDEPRASLLALEWIETSAPSGDHDVRLGRGLAALHRAGAPSFGLAHDGFIAGLPQPRATCATIGELWAAYRLEPMLRVVTERGLASGSMKRGLERVLASIDALVGPPEPPARLHGDLWGGNAIADELGHPVLIDPSAYGGHREIDLAMMQLFGGFSSRVHDVYAEAFPLAPGHEDRVALWQLYPLLVHVALFGGSYVAGVERALRALV